METREWIGSKKTIHGDLLRGILYLPRGDFLKCTSKYQKCIFKDLNK